MADKQPTGVEEGDNSLTASHPSPTSSDAQCTGGAQQEDTVYSDSGSDPFFELSKPSSVIHGEKVIIYGNTCAAVACAPLTSDGGPLPTFTTHPVMFHSAPPPKVL